MARNTRSSHPFYADLREVVARLAAGLRGLPERAAHESEPDSGLARRFAVLLVCRLLVLKFLEGGGWLEGNHEYLNAHLRRCGAARWWHDLRVSLPGWFPAPLPDLFDSLPGLDEHRARLDPAAVDLLFERLLNRYMFVVGERETAPAEQVCLRPGILASGYEHLIADPHSRGAYYTHPGEVALMCRESVWLALRLRCPDVAAEHIATLVSGAAGKGIPVVQGEQAMHLYTTLHSLTVCDPAAGCGTFPLAMARLLADSMGTLGEVLADYAPFCALVERGALPDPRQRLALKRHIFAHTVYGCDIDEVAVRIARARCWLELVAECEQTASLPQGTCAPNLVVGEALMGGADQPQPQYVNWEKQFTAVFERERPGFDLVIANPPYLRQEKIGRACREAGTPAAAITSHHLARRYSALTGERIDSRSDLYLYFFLRGLLLLREPAGVLCYISSSSWLDAGYGESLQRYLAAHHSLHAVVDSCWRSFEQASINTVITLVVKRPPRPAERALFLRLARRPDQTALPLFDAERACPSHPEQQVCTLAGEWGQARWVPLRLLTNHDGHNEGRNCRGEKTEVPAARWGGRFLRAPCCYDEVQRTLQPVGAPLARLARVHFGCHTGLNDFFYLDADTVASWEIEPWFLAPLLRSPSVVRSPLLAESSVPRSFVFACRLSKAELHAQGQSGALRYIAWGEQQVTRRRQQTAAGIAWPLVASARNRTPGWWALPPAATLPAHTFLQYAIGAFFKAPHTSKPLASDACFHRLAAHRPQDSALLAVLLHSSLALLEVLMLARSNLGQGALKLERRDVARLTLPDPAHMDNATRAQLEALLATHGSHPYPPLRAWHTSPLTQEVDRLLADWLNLPPALADAIPEAIVRLTSERLAKVANTNEHSKGK